MRTFAKLVGTFILVYLASPWLAVVVLHRLPVEHPERMAPGVAMLATIGVYSYLRRRFGDRLPQV